MQHALDFLRVTRGIPASVHSREARHAQLRWLARMRWVTAGVSLVLIVGAVPLMEPESRARLPVLFAWVSLLVGANLYFTALRDDDRKYERQIVTQMTVDLIVISGLLHATGGVENPLSIAYLFGVFIASVLLPRRKALAMTTLTAAALVLLVILGEARDLHVLSRLASLLAVMFGTLYFTTMVMERLRESDAQLRAVIDAAGFGILVADADARVVWTNGVPRELTAGVGADCAITLRSGQPRETEQTLETDAGRLRTFRHATFPVRNGAGDVVQAVQIVEEITARKELEAEAMHASRLAVLGQLAAGVAHEIGNPLSSLHARVQRMKRRPDPAAIAEGLDVLEQQIERIGRIVRGVSSLARNRYDSRAVLDAEAVVREAVALVRGDRRATKIVFREESVPPLPPVRGMRDELLQVVINLVLNAVEAMPDGGTLTTKTSFVAGNVRIEIGDSGAGIGDRVRARLFEPFFTTKADGTGLGLSISHSLVHAHGGAIEVESEPGCGSRFTIVLPAAPQEAVA